MEKYPPDAVSLAPAPSKGIVRLALGEFMIRCPYVQDHQVLNTRYEKHMEKCRRNYEKKYLMNGQPPLKLACKYNSGHTINAPELIFHEHHCDDKHKLILEYLLIDRKEIDDILAGNFDAKLVEGKQFIQLPLDFGGPTKGAERYFEKSYRSLRFDISGMDVDLDKLAWDLVKAGKVEALDLGPAFESSMGKVLWADPALASEKGVSPFQSGGTAISQTVEPLFHQRRQRHYRRASQEPPKKLGTLEEEEDSESEEYWNKRTRPDFDWLQHQFTYRPKGADPMKYPPGLSKAERKKFVEWNSDRLKLEHGVIREDDEELLRAAAVPTTRATPRETLSSISGPLSTETIKKSSRITGSEALNTASRCILSGDMDRDVKKLGEDVQKKL